MMARKNDFFVPTQHGPQHVHLRPGLTHGARGHTKDDSEDDAALDAQIIRAAVERREPAQHQRQIHKSSTCGNDAVSAERSQHAATEEPERVTRHRDKSSTRRAEIAQHEHVAGPAAFAAAPRR